MARVNEYIGANMKVIKTFVKIGKIPLSVMNDYDIYLFYKSIDYEQAQMKRYKIVADRFKCSIDTVRRAVVAMERKV